MPCSGYQILVVASKYTPLAMTSHKFKITLNTPLRLRFTSGKRNQRAIPIWEHVAYRCPSAAQILLHWTESGRLTVGIYPRCIGHSARVCSYWYEDCFDGGKSSGRKGKCGKVDPI